LKKLTAAGQDQEFPLVCSNQRCKCNVNNNISVQYT